MFEHVRALLFDFDGTLVRPSIDFAEMQRRVLVLTAGLGVDRAPLEHLPVLEIIVHAQAALGSGSEDAQRFAAQAEALVLQIEMEAADRTGAYAGVPEMLAELKARGYGVGIVTRNCRAAVERILAREPLLHDVLLTRDDVTHVKPDPRHLLSALSALGASPDEALMCGDHAMDVFAGHQIGLCTVQVCEPGVTQATPFAEVEPDLIVTHVTELLGHLDRH